MAIDSIPTFRRWIRDLVRALKSLGPLDLFLFVAFLVALGFIFLARDDVHDLKTYYVGDLIALWLTWLILGSLVGAIGWRLSHNIQSISRRYFLRCLIFCCVFLPSRALYFGHFGTSYGQIEPALYLIYYQTKIGVSANALVLGAIPICLASLILFWLTMGWHLYYGKRKP